MQQHIIHRQKVTLHVQNEEQSHLLQDVVSRLFKNGLADGIETILDDVAMPDEVIRIDKLVINLDGISLEGFEREFKEKFLSEFKSKLSASVTHVRQANDTTGIYLTRQASVSAALFYFLQHGLLPWYTAPKSIRQWGQEILSSLTVNEWQQLLAMLKQHRDNSAVLERFTLQFSDELLTKALLVAIPSLRDSWTVIYKDIYVFISEVSKHSSRKVRDELWLSVWQQSFEFTGDITQYIYAVVTAVLTKLNPGIPLLVQFSNDRYNALWKGNIQSRQVKDAVEKIIRDFSIFENKTGAASGAEEDVVADVPGNNSLTHDSEKIDEVKEKPFTESSPKGKDGNEEAANAQSGQQEKAVENISDKQAVKPAGAKAGDHQTGDTQTGQHEGAAKNTNDKHTANHSAANPTNKKPQEYSEEGLFVQNSGVILLHPFLMMYFKELGLLGADNRFINNIAQQRAVLLVYYLATGLQEAAEYHLALPKVLCGLPLDEVAPAYIELTEQEIEESANLLQAVTQHWQPLNKTSVEGLQVTFLQREGKLSRAFSGWRLQIEQKTVDILLGKLPWSFTTIRLPWMNGIINVDWYQ